MRTSIGLGFKALCAAILAGLGACTDDDLVVVQAPGAVAWQVIAQGQGGADDFDAQYRLIESQPVLESLFLSIGQGSGAVPPAVDFGQEVVYFATLGSKPTGGYGIAVERLQRVSSTGAAADALELDIGTIRPGSDCVVTTAVTAPYVMIAFPRVALDRGVINLNLREQVTDCSP